MPVVVCLRETNCHALHTTSARNSELDNLKLILEVEKHRVMYDTQHQFDKDNVDKDQSVAVRTETVL